jgi:hypothetical protein
MKRFSISIAVILAFLVALSGLNSCGEEDLGCQATDFAGEFVGKYWLLGLLPLDNNDTASITVSGNTLTITSSILGETFTAEYDPLTNSANVSNLNFDEFVIGNDTLFDISVVSGVIELDNSCENLYLTLSGVEVADGTINLPPIINGGNYPIRDVNMNTKNGLIRQ